MAQRSMAQGVVNKGFINIDKPQGMTSFDVVRRIRRAAQTKKVGHAGTLDPNATGVLPIAVGEATKLIDEIVDTRKAYRASVVLGMSTDTYDVEGERGDRCDASHVTGEDIEVALDRFRGEIMQTPPAYSAIKREGVPAYRAARRGDPMQLEPRPVTVHRIDLVDFTAGAPGVSEQPSLTLDVECGKGFYVRSLAHDLGQALGVGGYLEGLRRTRVGMFVADDAVPLDRALALLEAGRIEHLVHAPDVVLTSWPALILGRRQVAEVRQGRDLFAMPRPRYRARVPDDRARSYGPRGDLIALLRRGPTVGVWHPYRVFAPDTESQ